MSDEYVELKPWVHRDRLLQMALALIPDLMGLQSPHANSDADAELHEEELQKAAREWIDSLDREDPHPAVLNQVIGYMKGKAMAADDEAANAPTDNARQELLKKAEAFRGIASLLEGDKR